MAIEKPKISEGWNLYQPYYMDNQEDEDNPMLLEIKYVSATENTKFVDINLKMNRRRREVKKGETSRITKAKLKLNVKIKSGWIVDDKECKDIDLFLIWCPDDLLREIDEAMSDPYLLSEGNPKNFKTTPAKK